MLAADFATLPERVRKENRAFFTENERWLTRILKDGKKSGVFGFKSDAGDVAMTLFSTLEGAMLDARMFEDESRLQKAIDCWREFLLQKN